jgi:hypothetical protein
MSAAGEAEARRARRRASFRRPTLCYFFMRELFKEADE